MKIRTCFVSNSSSSSFVIKGEENIQKVIELGDQFGFFDYLQLDDTLYTSFISDCNDVYSQIYKLSSDYIDGSRNEPYDTKDFYEFEGERGVESVWIEKSHCKELAELETKIKNDLYNFINNWLEDYPLYNETNVQELCESNCQELHNLLGGIMNIVGYCKGDI